MYSFSITDVAGGGGGLHGCLFTIKCFPDFFRMTDCLDFGLAIDFCPNTAVSAEPLL